MSIYRFEALQLHVGQEQADPVTDLGAVWLIRQSLSGQLS